jgi:DNA-binding beta-propeller fold protein YncE
VVDSNGRRVWLVNPDNDSVTALGADSLQLEFEIAVGAHPMGVALDGFGNVWVPCQDDDSVWVIDGASGSVLDVLSLPWGSAPAAIVFSPDGVNGYIANRGSGQIQRVDAASLGLSATLEIGPTPRALAITGDGRRMLVTQFVSTDGVGTVRSDDLISRILIRPQFQHQP